MKKYEEAAALKNPNFGIFCIRTDWHTLISADQGQLGPQNRVPWQQQSNRGCHTNANRLFGHFVWQKGLVLFSRHTSTGYSNTLLTLFRPFNLSQRIITATQRGLLRQDCGPCCNRTFIQNPNTWTHHLHAWCKCSIFPKQSLHWSAAYIVLKCCLEINATGWICLCQHAATVWVLHIPFLSLNRQVEKKL